MYEVKAIINDNDFIQEGPEDLPFFVAKMALFYIFTAFFLFRNPIKSGIDVSCMAMRDSCQPGQADCGFVQWVSFQKKFKILKFSAFKMTSLR